MEGVEEATLVHGTAQKETADQPVSETATAVAVDGAAAEEARKG